MSTAAGDTDDRPALLVVGSDPDARRALESELTKRYGADYLVSAHAGHDDAAAHLEGLRRAGTPVALVISMLGTDDPDGVRVLDRLVDFDRSIRRAVAVRWGEFQFRQVLADAQAQGRIDHWLIRPQQARDEEFHRSVTELLEEWSAARPDAFEAMSIVGDPTAPRSIELRDLLARNHVPFGFHAADSPAGRRILTEARLAEPALPVVLPRFRGDAPPLEDPTDEELVDAFGAFDPIAPTDRFDVAIVGAGPAGLAAAVYAASEGLRTVVLERRAIGGQAGTTSLIRNYPGFARGVSGARLAHNAFQQARSFDVDFVFMRDATQLEPGAEHVVVLSDGMRVRARSVIVATGAAYRRLGLHAVDRLEGVGVYYTPTVSAVPELAGQRVAVVGGGNSSGQAALHTARYAATVTLVVRGTDLETSMSDYLIEQIAATPRIDVRLGTEIVDAGDDDRLRHLTVRARDSGVEHELAADALFVLIGARPHSDWLEGVVARDDRGFLLTGTEAGRSLLFESSLPGVFAIGDVRHGSVKRVASSVGEGAIAVQQLHGYLGGVPVG